MTNVLLHFDDVIPRYIWMLTKSTFWEDYPSNNCSNDKQTTADDTI